MNKYILIIPIFVLGANKGTVMSFMAMKAWVAAQVISSKLPVHNGLIIDFKISVFLNLP